MLGALKAQWLNYVRRESNLAAADPMAKPRLMATDGRWPCVCRHRKYMCLYLHHWLRISPITKKYKNHQEHLCR